LVSERDVVHWDKGFDDGFFMQYLLMLWFAGSKELDSIQTGENAKNTDDTNCSCTKGDNSIENNAWDPDIDKKDNERDGKKSEVKVSDFCISLNEEIFCRRETFIVFY
jgi:hypothetical protein